MYAFLVLGLVPGTHIQITFQLWLQLVAGLLAYGMLHSTGLKIYRHFIHNHGRQVQLHQRAQ